MITTRPRPRQISSPLIMDHRVSCSGRIKAAWVQGLGCHGSVEHEVFIDRQRMILYRAGHEYVAEAVRGDDFIPWERFDRGSECRGCIESVHDITVIVGGTTANTCFRIPRLPLGSVPRDGRIHGLRARLIEPLEHLGTGAS